ncbi:MAG: homoserine dehydrogenase [Ktedonobacterales bacterium]
MHIRLASLGFGNVGRALTTMLAEKAEELQRRYDLVFTFCGALTRSSGGWIAHSGIAPGELAASGWPGGNLPHGAEYFDEESLAFIASCPADILLELTTLDPKYGQPAIGHIRAALAAGRHVVTANKGPIAYAYSELQALATERRLALRFESTVLDGTPIFDMVESSLPATTIFGFRGLLNSTSNYVLGLMELGETLESALGAAQRLGIAEANPASDLEGWDSAIKATILANVLMGASLRPADIERHGLGSEAMLERQRALLPGQTLKQVVDCRRQGDSVRGSVRLEALSADDLLAHLSGMETALLFHTDTMQDLTIIEGKGGPGQTAFGVIADLVLISQQRETRLNADTL